MEGTGIRRHRVAIVGAGFSGLFAAKRLRRAADLDVTVIDRTNHHLFQPLLYQLATGILSEDQCKRCAPMTANGELLERGRINDRSRELRQQYGCKVQFSSTRFLMAARMAHPGAF